jgi:hypothetical protein
MRLFAPPLEEGDGLKGTYELALAGFGAKAAAVAQLRNALNAQKQPEGQIPQIARAEHVEVAARSIQELANFYTARLKALEELSARLTVLAAQGGEFEADGAQPKRVADAADRQARSAAELQADKARPMGGEVSKTWQELTRVRIEGVKAFGIKITAILPAALLLPLSTFGWSAGPTMGWRCGSSPTREKRRWSSPGSGGSSETMRPDARPGTRGLPGSARALARRT